MTTLRPASLWRLPVIILPGLNFVNYSLPRAGHGIAGSIAFGSFIHFFIHSRFFLGTFENTWDTPDPALLPMKSTREQGSHPNCGSTRFVPLMIFGESTSVQKSHRLTISQALSRAGKSSGRSRFLFLAEFLETRIIPERIEHWIEPEQCRRYRHV